MIRTHSQQSIYAIDQGAERITDPWSDRQQDRSSDGQFRTAGAMAKNEGADIALVRSVELYEPDREWHSS